jgi:hypothetical protein
MFDKFMDDLEKRSAGNKKKKQAHQIAIEEVELKRLRDLRYQERWQNRIEWRNTNDR